MAKAFEVTFLGTGTSQGVPMIACQCPVCTSSDWRDKRLRSSIHLAINGKSIIIDSGPDFRQQVLTNRISDLDAILFTHEHKDHIAGLDDVRGFNFNLNKSMPLYGHPRILDRLKIEFAYAFGDKKYPGVPLLELVEIGNDPFELFGTTIIPVEVMHYKLPVWGFRIGSFAYITDAKTIAESEKKKLIGLDTLILNGLQEEAHSSHFTLAEALELINELQPRVTYLTHISHKLGLHSQVEALKLPTNVRLAFDGLKLKVF